MQTKFFDVAKPSQINPSANSRPVIVGHQPMMVDPMVRGAANSVSSPAAIPNTMQTPEQPATHTAKIIQISDEMKSELASSTPEPLSNAQANPTSVANSTAIGEVLPNVAPEASPLNQVAVAPNETTAAPAHPAAAQTLVPAQDLSHLPHIPVSNSSASGPGKFKHILLWTVVIIVLGLFSAFLVIDAGLVGSSVHLPFHIFSRQN